MALDVWASEETRWLCWANDTRWSGMGLHMWAENGIDGKAREVTMVWQGLFLIGMFVVWVVVVFYIMWNDGEWPSPPKL